MGAAKDLRMEAQSRGWSLFDDKYVCPDCFEDEAIKNVILKNATHTACSYCRAESNKPIAADMNDVMPEIYFGIHQEWSDPNYEGVPWESAEGGWQGDVIDSWDLFHEELELGISNDQLRLDLVRCVEDRQWCQRDFWNLPAQRELRFNWDRFSEMVKHQTRFLFLREKTSSPNDPAPHTILKALEIASES